MKDWRDPNMTVTQPAMVDGKIKDVEFHSDAITRHAQYCMFKSQAPTWDRDPLYFARRPKKRKA